MSFFDLSNVVHRPGNDVMLSFSMQRSGQHLIIDWICRGLGDIVHFNHCRLYCKPTGLRLEPMTGRFSDYRGGNVSDSGKIGRGALRKAMSDLDYSREFYSVEDVSPADSGYRSLCKRYGPPVIVILRDPANWLASTLKHGKATDLRVRRKVEKLKNLLDFAVGEQSSESFVFVNFNRFITDPSYREALAQQLGLTLETAEAALGRVPDFGGGSSFGGQDLSTVAGVSQRWREYENDESYRELLADAHLRNLTIQFFGQDAAIL